MKKITIYKMTTGLVLFLFGMTLAPLMGQPAQATSHNEDDEVLTWGNLEEKTHEHIPEPDATDRIGKSDAAALIHRVQILLCRDINTFTTTECHPEDDPISYEILSVIPYVWTLESPVKHLGCGISSDALTVTVGQYRCALSRYTNFALTLLGPSDAYAHYSYYYRVGSLSWRLSEAQIMRRYYRDGQLRWDAPANLVNPNNVQRSPEVPPVTPPASIWEEEDDEGELVIENTVEAHNEVTGSTNQGSDQYYPIQGGYIRKKNGKCYFHGHDDSYAIYESCD